ncbi:type II secretion system F family protein [Erysipelothrix urinaevulpis]|uniref:type II secretion system F family protein n=1 Tax=Erysipelothrix urinaevulpis TaxID=2683717 RepID=UPI00135AF9D9|nr:type II secretion system F family protein [Erysipelothrix urinaevulpis]
MNYEVKYITKDGKETKRFITADNERLLLDILDKEGSYLLSFEEHYKTSSSKGKFNLKIASIFCYQLSTMLSAGVDLPTSLDLIQAKVTNQNERIIYRDLLESVQKGNSLSTSMEMQEGIFDDLLISMVRSGEIGGDLEGSLRTMSDHYEKNKKTRDKIKAAATYPIILLIVSMAIVLTLVVFVLPRITSSFPSEDLPATTAFLYAVSNFILKYWWLVIILLIGMIVLFKVLYDTPRIRRKIHRNLLYLPVLGKPLRTIYSARLARSFASLYSQGVSTLEMISLAATTLNNAYFEKRLNEVEVEVSHGQSISKSLDSIEEFDPMLSSMMKIGEETGDLDGVLKKISVYFDQEADAAIERIVSLLEPVMIVVMGVMIAFIVLSIMQPILKMYDSVQ